MQSYPETLALCKVLIENPVERVLEIGSGRGSTPVWQFLLEGNGLVVTVDINSRFYDLVKHLLDPSLVRFILGDSTRAETVKKVRHLFDYGTVDLLFIDGEHSPPFVRSDYTKYSPFVRPGGIIALHDTVMSGPGTLLDELRNEGLRVDEVREGCGLGIVFREELGER